MQEQKWDARTVKNLLIYFLLLFLSVFDLWDGFDDVSDKDVQSCPQILFCTSASKTARILSKGGTSCYGRFLMDKI